MSRCPTCGQALPRYKPDTRARFVTSGPRVGSVRWFRTQTGHEDGCVMCGDPLPPVAPGRSTPHGNRKTCSNACRQAAYRIRKKAEQDEGGST